MDHLLYRRHFLLLAGFALLLVAAGRIRLTGGLSTTFALYGSLHALALALSWRCPKSIGRCCLFIAVAAALSATTFQAGLLGQPWIGALVPGIGLYATACISSMLGAAAYGIALRSFGVFPLNSGALVGISAGCAVATCAALFSIARFHFGQSWLAILWWFAYSGGLWCCERRRRLRINRAAISP
jgi:hypothetical protein